MDKPYVPDEAIESLGFLYKASILIFRIRVATMPTTYFMTLLIQLIANSAASVKGTFYTPYVKQK